MQVGTWLAEARAQEVVALVKPHPTPRPPRTLLRPTSSPLPSSEPSGHLSQAGRLVLGEGRTQDLAQEDGQGGAEEGGGQGSDGPVWGEALALELVHGGEGRGRRGVRTQPLPELSGDCASLVVGTAVSARHAAACVGAVQWQVRGSYAKLP